MHELALSGTGGVAGLVFGYVALFLLFGLLERVFPEKPQRRLRPGFGVDTLWFFADGVARIVAGIAVVVGIAFTALWLPHPGVPDLASQPRWLQVLEVLLIGDLLQYGVHRALHGRRLWRFHAVRWVVASPAFHHWHHTAEAEGMNRNFAGLFPFIDLAFGTFFLPRRASESYGLGGGQRMPLSLTRQLAYPFLAGRQEVAP